MSLFNYFSICETYCTLSIVRSQTPKRSAKCFVVSNRALHRYSQIACLHSDGPNYLTPLTALCGLENKARPGKVIAGSYNLMKGKTIFLCFAQFESHHIC